MPLAPGRFGVDEQDLPERRDRSGDRDADDPDLEPTVPALHADDRGPVGGPRGMDLGVRVDVADRALEARDAGQVERPIELIADEVAPSLRWASAKVNRNERREGGGSRPPASGGTSGTDFDINNEEPF